MEINISPILNLDHYSLCNSQANLGPNAARITWSNATRQAKESPLLKTPEELQAMRDFVRSSGGWTRQECNEFTPDDLNAQLYQWVAGDIREAFGDDLPDDPAEWDWNQYEQDARDGRISSRLFLADDGQLFFYLGE